MIATHPSTAFPVPGQPLSSSAEARVCARDGCTNPLVEVWEETESLCGRCAVETELFDREARRERLWSTDRVAI